MRRALLVAGVLALALVAAPAASAARPDLHDARYCEILELHGVPPTARVTVWNTIGLNDCPDAKWRAFDAGALARELGATLVVLNGPRHFLMDSATARIGRVRSFHGMRMRKVATIAIHSLADLAQTPYTDRTITRTNTWRWRRGRTVFELVAPGGDVYVMQSYAQVVEPSLTLRRLRSLGRRLTLPPGWHYRVRRLARPLVLSAHGSATVLQDELRNTYQLAHAARPAGRARRRHTLRLTGATRSVPPATPGTVEDHGVVKGSPLGRGRIVLVGRLANSRLTGTFRLTFPRGQLVGEVAAPFTIADGVITFDGVSRLTGGTGAFRGVRSGALKTHDTNTLDGQNGMLSVSGAARW